MRATLAACLVVALLAAGAAPAAAQLPPTIQALLERKELRPFINEVLGIRACLSDPNLSQFNIDQCPSLLRLLDALNLGNTNPAVSCEDSCVQQFAKLSDTCAQDLRDKFEGDSTTIGRLASEFFVACDELVADKLAAAAPSPAPAEPLPLVTPSVEAEVVESPPAPVPEPVPVAPTTSGASALPKAALSALALVAAAAFTLA